jgi:hypothetical protein
MAFERLRKAARRASGRKAIRRASGRLPGAVEVGDVRLRNTVVVNGRAITPKSSVFFAGTDPKKATRLKRELEDEGLKPKIGKDPATYVVVNPGEQVTVKELLAERRGGGQGGVSVGRRFS